jgi:acetoin utilization deacetylase AcuC-like enzyme
MEKYDLIPQQLLHEGTITPAHLFEPQPMTEEDILTTHTAEYWHKLKTVTLSKKEERRIGFPQSPDLTLREQIIAQGTLDCARLAIRHGIAMNVSGGTHHAFADRGEGFCLLNDIALAANVLLRDRLARNILIIDLDVHQGNGTAAIFAGNPRVFTFSMHCHSNFPMEKEHSNLDIGLPPGTGDDHFLETLHLTLPKVLEQSQPDHVFYLSGVDVLATDKLGRFKLTREGCKTRDKMVLQTIHHARLPLTISMGGGYSYHIRDIVEAHCNTFRLAAQQFFLY